MWTCFRHTFNRYRWQILGWGLATAALGMILVPFYDTFVEQEETFLKLLDAYPPELMAFFGDMANFTTPAGFLDVYLSYIPIIIGIFGVSAGSALLAADEENGRLDLILAHPVSRTGLFAGRLLAFVAATVAIQVLSWLGFCLPLGNSALGLNWGEMALPFVAILVQTLLYGTLALLLSMLLPARRLASMTSGMIMVVSYVLTSLATLNTDLTSIARLLPHDYYQGGGAVEGLDMTRFLWLLAVSALFIALAWWRFLRRDIRVGGEGGWQLASLSPWKISDKQ